VVDLEMKCDSPMTIGRVYEMGLSYLSGKNLILGGLKWYAVTTGTRNPKDLCGVDFRW
jgi:hypothetical protein